MVCMYVSDVQLSCVGVGGWKCLSAFLWVVLVECRKEGRKKMSKSESESERQAKELNRAKLNAIQLNKELMHRLQHSLLLRRLFHN